MSTHIDDILMTMMRKGASDTHLGADRPPFYRIDGDLMPSEYDVLSDEDMERLAKQLLTPKREHRLEEENEIDFSYVLTKEGQKGRFHVNIFRQNGTVGAAIRHVNDKIPSFEELNLPLILEELSLEKRGI